MTAPDSTAEGLVRPGRPGRPVLGGTAEFSEFFTIRRASAKGAPSVGAPFGDFFDLTEEAGTTSIASRRTCFDDARV
ncbi:hypothetical protein ACFWZ2_17075 [Streptomyces sp. NPDC059002]|uniref:hypothetical protein n=1 Tax=Streptomyces sp. NPDC059002 TaxID=3346690 RepID=UPI00367EAFA2